MDLTQDAESQSEEVVADPEQLHQELLEFSSKFKDSISQVIIGQQEILDQLVVALFCRGHVLITGVPGLAKTLLIRSLAQLFHLKFNRIQCTPDLMPSDITGVEILEESGTDRSFRFIPGPVFTNLLLADEISPDTCRFWDQRSRDANDRILDKDRFRKDLGGVMEAYGEVLKRVHTACPNPRNCL